MKRFLTAALLCAVALSIAVPVMAGGYYYKWQTVTWGSDSTSFYIPSGASIAVKNSQTIVIPSDAYWPTASDSLPFFHVIGTISAAGAATDTLMLDYQWTLDGVNYIPALDWDIDAQVHVGAGLYFTFTYIPISGTRPVYIAAGAGDWAAGVPTTYRITVPLRGAQGLRLVVHPSHAVRTLNGKLSARIGILCRDNP
jgi:hypothetical protein